MPCSIERLECTVKNYAWGKLGQQSEVARLFAAGHEYVKIGHNVPYAELWIGTHPDGPALICSNRKHLSEHIGAGKVQNVHLPYIMKIMSINHTLSLQVHPTKQQAITLNQKDPSNYPDQNHKPELAYALTRFELLCGFRPVHEIVQNLKAFPELCQTIGLANTKHFIDCLRKHSPDSPQAINALKKCFTHMMYFEKENVNELLANLHRRINAGVYGCLTSATVDVMKDMFKRFPTDIGCLSPLYLNHIVLEPGECVYYGAQELHAYLSGECVECVSCSNNTIRAGLTNKFVDRENLVEVLNYRMVQPSFYVVHPRRLTNCPQVKEFVPDCKDFALHSLEIPSGNMPVDLPALECSSTFVLVEAEHASCMELDRDGNILRQKFDVKRGDIFYIPAHHTIRFLNAKRHVKGFRTFSFEQGPDHSKRIMAKQIISMDKQQNDEIGKKKMAQLLIGQSPKPTTKTATINTTPIAIYDIEAEMDGFL